VNVALWQSRLFEGSGS